MGLCFIKLHKDLYKNKLDNCAVSCIIKIWTLRAKGFGKDEMKQLRIRKHRFHGEWNYTIRPQT